MKKNESNLHPNDPTIKILKNKIKYKQQGYKRTVSTSFKIIPKDNIWQYQ